MDQSDSKSPSLFLMASLMSRTLLSNLALFSSRSFLLSTLAQQPHIVRLCHTCEEGGREGGLTIQTSHITYPNLTITYPNLTILTYPNRTCTVAV